MSNLLSNIIKKNKVIISIFFIIYFIYIFCHYKSRIAIFFDVPAIFFEMIYQTFERNSNYFLYFQDRTRFFIDFLVSIPLNICIHLFHPKKLIDILSFFGSSYLIIHLFALILNFIVSLRTKRYDIAIFAFAFYTFFSMPNLIWCIRELHIAILFYFILLSYFLSKEKLKKIDFIPVLLISIFIFESYEIIIPFGFIIFISSLLYLYRRKETYNIKYKMLIGISSLLAAIHAIIKTFALNQGIMSNSIAQYVFGIKESIEWLFNSNLIITFFALIYLIIIIVYKREHTNKVYILLPILLFPLLIVLAIQTQFYPYQITELQFFGVALVFILPVELLIILLDYFKIDISTFNKAFLPNLFFLACLVGILNLLWQIKSCSENLKYINYLKNILTTSNETIVTMPLDVYDKYKFMRFDTCYGTIYKSILIYELSDNYIVSNVLFPNKKCYHYDVNNCMDTPEYTYYDKDSDIIVLQNAPIKTKTKYYDATPIAEDFLKENRLGTYYKDIIPQFSYITLLKQLMKKNKEN